jgi:hypothetical protein
LQIFASALQCPANALEGVNSACSRFSIAARLGGNNFVVNGQVWNIFEAFPRWIPIDDGVIDDGDAI